MWEEVIQDGGRCINLKVFNVLFLRVFPAYENHGLGVYQLEWRTGIEMIKVKFIGSMLSNTEKLSDLTRLKK